MHIAILRPSQHLGVLKERTVTSGNRGTIFAVNPELPQGTETDIDWPLWNAELISDLLDNPVHPAFARQAFGERHLRDIDHHNIVAAVVLGLGSNTADGDKKDRLRKAPCVRTTWETSKQDTPDYPGPQLPPP